MFLVGVSGGAGEFENIPVGVDPDSPIGMVLDQMVATAHRADIRFVGLSALFGMLVVELFPVVHIATPDGLPAGRELAHVEDSGDLVAEFLGGI